MNPAFTPALPAYFSALNDKQLEAAQHVEGPLLILAGAGTGKTRVLTTRFAHLVATRRAWPNQILCVTFTNKAATEMRERVAHLLPHGTPLEGLWLGTFHALSARILRRYADRVGLPQSFTILDTDDQLRLIKQILEAQNIDPKKNPPKRFAFVIDDWKNRGLTPETVPPEEARMAAEGKAIEIYKTYQQRLLALGSCDFGDLLLHVLTLLRAPENADVRETLHRQFKYIMVDEYQDTNIAQYLWLRLLVNADQNLCCVGDDDQSIYGWRGAEVKNILRFEQEFKGAHSVRLEQNYRSTGHILKAASAVISHNATRLGKTLWTNSDNGQKLYVQALWDGGAEAKFVAEQLETLRHKAEIPSYNNAAILVRAGHQMREFEEAFNARALPYRVIGGPRFYERMEVRDMLAYLRLVVQPADDLALERIINLPKRGVGATTLETLHTRARTENISLLEAIKRSLADGKLRPSLRGPLQVFVTQLETWQGLLEHTPAHALADRVLEESGYRALWKAEKTIEAEARLENLDELLTAIAEAESLPAFLEHVSLVMERNAETGSDAVTIMTMHAAKGLEFDVVFLTGWEEGLFPSQRAMDENGLQGLEEERRLAYVAITRARKHAFITYAANRRVFGNWMDCIASRFVAELPAESIEIGADIGLHAAGRSMHWDSSGFNPAFASKPAPLASHNKLQGKRIVHPQFGGGVVVHADGDKLDIRFDSGATKRLLASFIHVEGDHV